MDELNVPKWMHAIPPICGAIVGIIGAATGSRMVVILGIPLGLVAGVGLLYLYSRYRKD